MQLWIFELTSSAIVLKTIVTGVKVNDIAFLKTM